MNTDLKGKVAVVSGGATLIGKAVVQALVNAGAAAGNRPATARYRRQSIALLSPGLLQRVGQSF